MKANWSPRFILGCFLMLLVLIGACWQLSSVMISECAPETALKHNILTQHNFEERWVLQNTFISASERAIYLVANDSHLVLYGAVNTCEASRLVMLSTNDGEIITSGISRMPANLGVDNVAYDSERVYLGYNSPGQAVESTTNRAGGVIAYGGQGIGKQVLTTATICRPSLGNRAGN